MTRIVYNEENFGHCRCGVCPVQRGIDCVKERLDKFDKFAEAIQAPEDTVKVYCSIGKSNCEGLHSHRPCLCPTCLVWYKNNLRGTHFCTKGSADEVK